MLTITKQQMVFILKGLIVLETIFFFPMVSLLHQMHETSALHGEDFMKQSRYPLFIGVEWEEGNVKILYI